MLTTLILALTTPDLNAILDSPELKGALYSATVTDLEGTVLFERNPDQRVMPASNQKLISCAFALFALGSDYIPKTRIWKLKDRIVVESAGDPSMSYAQLLQARRTLKLSGKLPVYLSQSYRGGIPASWEYDDLPNRYAAQVSAFSFDQGAFEIWAEKGRPFLLPASFGVKLVRDNNMKPGSSRYDPLFKTAWYGSGLPKARTRLDTLALPNPDLAAASVLGARLHYTKSIPNRPPDLTIEGKPLPEILKTCLVKSDNNMAENLLLMAAAKQGDLGEAPYEAARERVSKFLIETVGVDKSDLRIYDGSGLSRHNLVTSRSIAKLLQWANRQSTAPLWRSCLVSPLNGTLKGRLKDVEFRGKTGTLDMVVSLSGYVKTPDGNEAIMSLLLNHFTCSSAKARDIADGFAKTLATATDGPQDALSCSYETRGSDPKHLVADRHRPGRSGLNRRTPRPGQDRRTEPSYATVH